MNVKERSKKVQEVINSLLYWNNYVRECGNECAHTDRVIESALEALRGVVDDIHKEIGGE